MTTLAELEAGEFQEILPEKTSSRVAQSPITMATVALRYCNRVSISFSESAIQRLQGWPRFNVDFDPKRWAIRIRANKLGRFEARMTPRGRRYTLRFPLPPELKVLGKLREPAPHHYAHDGWTLFVVVPPAFRKTDPVAAAAAARLRAKDHAEAARRAVPAPRMS